MATSEEVRLNQQESNKSRQVENPVVVNLYADGEGGGGGVEGDGGETEAKVKDEYKFLSKQKLKEFLTVKKVNSDAITEMRHIVLELIQKYVECVTKNGSINCEKCAEPNEFVFSKTKFAGYLKDNYQLSTSFYIMLQGCVERDMRERCERAVKMMEHAKRRKLSPKDFVII
jgi:histone H3/H4